MTNDSGINFIKKFVVFWSTGSLVFLICWSQEYPLKIEKWHLLRQWLGIGQVPFYLVNQWSRVLLITVAPLCHRWTVFMMTSSNGNTFRVTGHYCGEFTGDRTRSFDVFFDLHPNKRLSKQSWGWWFETPSRRLWRHCNKWRKCALMNWIIFGSVYCHLFGVKPLSEPGTSILETVSVWTNTDLLSIGPLGTSFGEILMRL